MAAEKTPVQEIAEQMSAGGVLVRRWLGCWIDFITLGALFLGPAALVGTYAPLDPPTSDYVVWGVVALCVAYFPVTEGFWGRSLGKLITGLKVVDKDGRAPGLWRALLRTLLRLFEVNPLLFGGVPAGIAVLCTKRKQRLGDLVADTYVIDVAAWKQKLDVDATLADMRRAPAA
jgi:uncharacterized RDD family membrane protein YckC